MQVWKFDYIQDEGKSARLRKEGKSKMDIINGVPTKINLLQWRSMADRIVVTQDGRERASWYKMGLLNALLEFKPKDCLEIGTRMGGTAVIFGDYFVQHRRDGMLVTCDLAEWVQLGGKSVKQLRVYPHSMQGATEYKSAPRDSYLKDWADHIATSVEDNILIIKQAHPEPFDFAFVDGDHTWEGVDRDWQIVRATCRKGAMVVFDDILDKRNDCRQWYDEEIRPRGSYEFGDFPVFIGMGLTVL